jgi:thiamine biosynthesis protein ThiI
VTTLPVLRPLLGFDKGEITDQAARLGTLETSIQPDADCCQLFVPRHPATRAEPIAVAAAEARLDVPELVALAVSATERTALCYPERPVGAPRAEVG